MTLLDLLHLLRKKWYIWVALTLIGALAAGGYCFIQQSESFTAKVSLYVSAQTDYDNEVTTPADIMNASQQMLNDAALLAESETISSIAASNLGLPDLGAYSVEVTSQTSNNRIIEIAVSGSNAEEVERVANQLAKDTAETVMDVVELSSVKVLSEAIVAPGDSGPNLAKYGAVGLLAGLFLGIVVIVVMDMMDRRVRDEEDFEEKFGLPVLASIDDPSHKAGAEMAASLRNASKTLYVNTRFASEGEDVKSITVASSTAEEQNAAVANDLAIAMATAGNNVLLVEGDLRGNTLSPYVDASASASIEDVISGKALLEDTTASIKLSGDTLFFLKGVPTESPLDILSSECFAGLLSEMRSKYDYIVINTPPLDKFVDASVIASITDGTIFVTRQHFANEDVIGKALVQLASAHARILGACMTSVKK